MNRYTDGTIGWFTDPANVEPQAFDQISRTASMPFVKGVRVMPDVHLGKGSTVGTVIATKGAVMPAAVGVDIGCGMIAIRTSLRLQDLEGKLEAIRTGIERRIPLGVGSFGYNSRILPSAESRIEMLHSIDKVYLEDTMERRAGNWRMQLGSLGGGNHFIEVSVGYRYMGDANPFFPLPGEPLQNYDLAHPEVWVFLHSGSRGVGNRTGVYWTREAQLQAATRGDLDKLPDRDLAYLIEGTEQYDMYLEEASWCQTFAMHNRYEMADRVLEELKHTVGVFEERERINCHHNYLTHEVYGKDELLITRKGAIDAHAGIHGLIPGSMGTNSYVVVGLGNDDAYNTAPHGAGRRMSRTAARKQFTLTDLQARMNGIEARVRPELLDEHPDAYKDIEHVMEEARSLVRPVYLLKQLINVKGD